MHRFFHEEDDNYFRVPDDPKPIGEYLWMYSTGEPGSFSSVVDEEKYDEAVISAYVSDISPKTVRKIYDAAREYAEKNFNDEKVTAKVGGGAIAVARAFNNNVAIWLAFSTLFSALASFLFVLIFFRSFVAGILLLAPLFIGSTIFLMVMDITGIEINSNISSAMAIAMGMGIDAELYFIYRFREEFTKSRDFHSALILGFTKIRKALIYSHGALIIGCWSLIPVPLYVGYMGYGMGMIILLCFLVSFILPPFLISVFKPKFLLK